MVGGVLDEGGWRVFLGFSGGGYRIVEDLGMDIWGKKDIGDEERDSRVFEFCWRNLFIGFLRRRYF